jgi:hypothetical protein
MGSGKHTHVLAEGRALREEHSAPCLLASPSSSDSQLQGSLGSARPLSRLAKRGLRDTQTYSKLEKTQAVSVSFSSDDLPLMLAALPIVLGHEHRGRPSGTNKGSANRWRAPGCRTVVREL